MQRKFNSRILVVDDEEVVREGLREILTSRKKTNTKLTTAASSLFGAHDYSSKPMSSAIEFSIQTASSGQLGIDLARAALAEGHPFAVVFLDMRMPGMDGLETARQLRKIDSKVEILFLTAYSDYTIEEINEEIGVDVSYFCKPFSPDEVKQLATKGVYDWNRLRDLEELIEIITSLKVEVPVIGKVLENILSQLSGMVGATSAAFYSGLNSGSPVQELTSGLDDHLRMIGEHADSLCKMQNGEVTRSGSILKLRMRDHGVLTFLSQDNLKITTNRLYLLRLFTQQAGEVLENAELKVDLVSKEKMAQLGQSIGAVAHDLRAPMTVIHSAVEYMEEEKDLDTIQELVCMVKHSSQDFFGMVDDILEFSKGVKLNGRRFDLKGYLNDLETRVLLLLRERPIDFTMEIAANVQWVVWDISKFGRALFNLIGNSIEALDQHPEIPNRHIQLSVNQHMDTITLRIKDNGPGIPDKIIDRLFQPFATQGKTGGTGLGCAIAKQYVEAHQGKITVTSNPGAGTEFVLNIPAVPRHLQDCA